jgi:hypothetical protein
MAKPSQGPKVSLDGFGFFSKCYVMKEKYDKLQCRCPRLGHEVAFSYCRQESGVMPCQRIIACWGVLIPVETWLKDEMPAEQWDLFCRQEPEDKLTTLVDLVGKARKVQD